MGIKLLWTGLTIVVAVSHLLTAIPALEIAGALLMVIGLVLYWFDK